MFMWLKKIIQDHRIASTFPVYDAQCRKQHLALSQQRFATKQLDDQVSFLMQPIMAGSDKRFAKLINGQRVVISELNISLSNQHNKLQLFLPNYKQQIERKYAQRNALFSEKEVVCQKKNQLHAELKETYEDKNEAYENLNEVQADIDGWYARSERTPWLLGNGGKKLPNHAFFSQSHGDLACDKAGRDDAYAEIQDCKEAIYDLKQSIGECKGQLNTIFSGLDQFKQDISKLKQDRQVMHDLKKKGCNRPELEKSIKRDAGKLKHHQVKLSGLEIKQNEFILAEKQQAGVIKLEQEISELLCAKKKFIAGFDDEIAINHRKQAHRKIWLLQKG